MSCGRWQERIAEFVGEGPEPGEIRSHVAECAGCAELKRELEDARLALGVLRSLEPTDRDLEAMRRGVLAKLSKPRPERPWLAWWPAMAGASAVAAAWMFWLAIPRDAGPPPLVRFPVREPTVQVARAAVLPPRPRPPKPASRGVVIESVREMADAETGATAQLVRIRTQDPRVELYWVIGMEGDQPR